jgi:hypothetical protein
MPVRPDPPAQEVSVAGPPSQARLRARLLVQSGEAMTGARARRPLDIAMSEKDFRQLVLDLAQTAGWRCYFTWRSTHSPAGFPDLTMVRGSRLIFAELKSERGTLSDAQEEWLADLNAVVRAHSIDLHPGGRVPIAVYVWCPSDWPDIVQVLTAELKRRSAS